MAVKKTSTRNKAVNRQAKKITEGSLFACLDRQKIVLDGQMAVKISVLHKISKRDALKTVLHVSDYARKIKYGFLKNEHSSVVTSMDSLIDSLTLAKFDYIERNKQQL